MTYCVRFVIVVAAPIPVCVLYKVRERPIQIEGRGHHHCATARPLDFCSSFFAAAATLSRAPCEA